MWKKLVLVLMIGSFMVGTVFAQTYKEEFDAGRAKYNAQDYAGALVDFQAAYKLNPGKGTYYLGCTLSRLGRRDEALALFMKTAGDEKISPRDRAMAQRCIGRYYQDKDEHEKAIVEFDKAIAMGSFSAKKNKITSLEALGKTVEAQQGHIEMCKLQSAPLASRKRALSKIDKVALGKEEYLKLLDTMLLAIPANEKNAEFLGLLKSEQEKLR